MTTVVVHCLGIKCWYQGKVCFSDKLPEVFMLILCLISEKIDKRDSDKLISSTKHLTSVVIDYAVLHFFHAKNKKQKASLDD